MKNRACVIAMKEFERYNPKVLEKILQRKEKELIEAEKSPCVGSGGLLTLETEVAAISKLLKKTGSDKPI